MTTIAYRDGILAADTQSTTDNHVIDSNTTKKILVKEDYIVAYVGDLTCIYEMLTWLSTGEIIPERLSDNYKDVDAALLVFSEKREPFKMLPSGLTIPLSLFDDFLADGSGYEIAMGAMAFGASAKEAVEIACRLDVYTGGSVQTVDVSKYTKSLYT